MVRAGGTFQNYETNGNLTSTGMLRQNYISSILTINMILLILLVSLLIQLSVLLIVIAVKARKFLLKIVAEGIVIDDVRPFPTPFGSNIPPSQEPTPSPPPSPPSKPKRSRTKYNERLVQ